MALINVSAAIPSQAWAVLRFLATSKKPVPVEQVRSLLSPASLLPAGKEPEKDPPFDRAVRTLDMLGLLVRQGDTIGLTAQAHGLPATDFAAFSDLLRQAVLAPERNTGVGDSDEQTGARDLTRALAWFLTRDPLGAPVGRNDFAEEQKGILPAHVGLPITNDVRWGLFYFWASSLGFAAKSVLPAERQGQKLVPDCTAAVRHTIQSEWSKGERIDAATVVSRVLERLPVLPGGRYARELGLHGGTDPVSASLSFALLSGQEHGWISLDRKADAPHDVLLTDPDKADGAQRVTWIVVEEALRG